MTEQNACSACENKDNLFEKQIIIIGAGISGLACAYRLKELGFQNVKILEGRNRIGGRIYGIDVGSKFIELGAQWIHGETGNIIYEIAESNGLVNKNACNYLDALRSFSNFSSEESKALIKMFDFLEEKVNNFSENFGSYTLLTYLDELFKTFLSELGPCDFLDRINEGFEWYCNFLNEVNGCQDLSTLSLDLLNNYEECDGNQTVEVKNGFSSLLSVFLNVIQSDWILKSKTVAKIDWSDFKSEFCDINNGCDSSSCYCTKNCKIKLFCQDDEVFLADHVVVTLPLGCLKKYNESLFSPPLCDTKQKAIHCLGYGAINKIYLEFEEVFWKSDAVYNVFWEKTFDLKFSIEALDKSNKLFWVQYVDRIAYTPNHCNLLCIWVTGEGAVMMESLNDEQIISDSMKLIELVLVKEIPKPSKIFRSSWMSDPFSYGSYSYLSVDCKNENIFPHDLAEPEYTSSLCSKHPVLLFAGEATHDLYFSTVHGAYETGVREAERIFQHYRGSEKINTMESVQNKMMDISVREGNLRDNIHIVIVGAGLAGLVCGHQLSKSNFSKITILEAQDKIGGRISSVHFNDYFLELGAQWIHGANNALFDFANAYKLLPQVLEETAFEGKGLFCTSNGNIIEESIVEEVKKILNFAKSELEKGCYNKKESESVLSFFSKAFESHINKCKDDSRNELKRQLFNWYIKFEAIDNACDNLNDIAVQSFTEWDECPEELYHIEFSNGFSSLLNTLVSQLPNGILHLKKPVKTIKWCENLSNDICIPFSQDHSAENSPIVLECENEEIFSADVVVVTASAGFLKKNMDTFFSPPLPKKKQEAFEKVGFGTVNKIFLIYDRPFWTSDDMGFQLVWESSSNENCEKLIHENPWVLDITGFDVVQKYPNILLGWIGGEGAKLMETVDEEIVSDVCSDLLRIFLNCPDIPNPQVILRSCWYSNPYIRGSYSSRTLDYYLKDSTMDDLQYPIYSKCVLKTQEEIQWPIISFAGEAYDERSFSSAHGAFQSGLKVADQLITLCSKIEACQERV